MRVDRHRRILLPHLVAHQAVRRRRRDGRAHVEGRAARAEMRHEHLPPHAFARPLVERVGDDADDLDRSAWCSARCPNPMRLPTALAPLKKCSANLRLTIATFEFGL